MRTVFTMILSLALTAAAAFSQRLLVESDTQEGQLLQKIDGEQDKAKKLALLEEFSKRFPNHEAATWVLSHMQNHYLEVKDLPKALQVGVRILSLDSSEVAAAHGCLKAAEEMKDVELIRKWSLQTSQAARRVMLSKKPEYGDDEEIAAWKSKVDFARQVERYTEYALYFASVTAKETRTKTELIAALEQRNPMSEYLAQMRTAQKTAVVRQVDIEEAVRAAEADFANGLYGEDLLMMVATHYMNQQRENAKVLQYSAKVLEIVQSKSKPEDMTPAEWEHKRAYMIGTANWMIGLLSSTQERFATADKHLRASLPYLRNSDMVAGAYYHLGYVNYRLAEAGDRIRIHEAIRFTKECTTINSTVQAQAIQNLKSMKAEYAIP